MALSSLGRTFRNRLDYWTKENGQPQKHSLVNSFLCEHHCKFLFLATCLKEIPIGTAYAIYTSIGIVGTVLIGMIFFKEPTNWERFAFILMIIGGVVGLKMSANG